MFIGLFVGNQEIHILSAPGIWYGIARDLLESENKDDERFHYKGYHCRFFGKKNDEVGEEIFLMATKDE
jgi:hypothetical protein